MGYFKGYIILILAISGLIYYKYSNNPNSNGENYENLTLSKLLKRVLGVVHLLEQLNEEVIEMLENDPFQSLIDEKVKPSYDELASVKKQTEIYENMARIPGGPTNFMTTAIKTVEKLETEIHDIELRYRKVVYKMADDLASAKENFQNLGMEIQILFFKNLEELQRIGIQLPSMTDDGPPAYYGNATLDEIIPVITVLIPLFTKFEKAQDELNQTLTEMGIETPFQFKQVKGTPAETILKRFERIDGDIQNVIELHYDKLASLGPVVAGILNTMSKKLVEITPHHSKTKEKYEKLVSIYDYDLIRTKERINDLKNPVKATDEL